MEFVIDLALWGYSLAVLGFEAASLAVTAHWLQLFWVVGGAMLWTVVQPVLSVTVRFWSAVGRFVYKWAELTKLCFRRYQRFTHGAKFRARARGDRWGTLYEALWATPMVVLEARQEHLYGLGRLIHKWLDAFHAYWCVFLADTIEASGRVIAKYWAGSRSAVSLSCNRAWRALRLLYSLAYVSAYAAIYVCTLGYDWIEWVCQGWSGVTVLLISLNYYFATNDDAVDYYEYAFDRDVVRVTVIFVTVGLLSHLCRWYSSAAEGRSPVQLAEDRYAAWVKDMEEQDQAERLSEAFWRQDGAVPGMPRPRVPTLSSREAERRRLRALIETARREEVAKDGLPTSRETVSPPASIKPGGGRRGCRPEVGEIVTSEIAGHGGHRLGHGDESAWAPRALHDRLYEEQLEDDSGPSVARSTRPGPFPAGWP